MSLAPYIGTEIMRRLHTAICAYDLHRQALTLTVTLEVTSSVSAKYYSGYISFCHALKLSEL